MTFIGFGFINNTQSKIALCFRTGLTGFEQKLQDVLNDTLEEWELLIYGTSGGACHTFNHVY